MASLPPTFEELLALDDKLADIGIPIFSRPFEAAMSWAERTGDWTSALENEHRFRATYQTLYESVDFKTDAFLTLAVSARGVSYFLKPPLGYGEFRVEPLEYVGITQNELGRLYKRHEPAFNELFWQATDGTDLFMALANFHSKAPGAQNMMTTAVHQMTASSRQLVASEVDSSLPQGMAMAVELAGKAVLLHLGEQKGGLKKLGHDLPAIVKRVSELAPSPCDAEIGEVALKLPEYVQVRYEAPVVSILDAQRLLAGAMFVIADLLRRTNHDQIYWKLVASGGIPRRTFMQT